MSHRVKVVAVVAVLAAAAMPAAAAVRPHARTALAQLSGDDGCLADRNAEGSQAGCSPAKALLKPAAVALSPDGANAYIAAADGIVTAKRDATTGGLTFVNCITNNGTRGFTGTDGECTDGDALVSGTGVAASPDGSQVYAIAAGSSALDVFTRKPDDGTLTQAACFADFSKEGRCTDATALEGARDLAVSPDGKNVYVVAGSDATGSGNVFAAVAIFARDEAGALNEVGCVSDDGSNGACVNGTALAGAQNVAVSPDGNNVYVGGTSLLTFKRDPATGLLTQTGCMFTNPPAGPCTDDEFGDEFDDTNDLVVTPDGKSVYAGVGVGINEYTRADDGSLTATACYREPVPQDEETDTSDEEDTGDSCDVEAARAAATKFTEIPALDFVTALAVSPDNGTVYAASNSYAALIALEREAGKPLAASSCVSNDEEATGCSPRTSRRCTAM
jgi:DNA-binding beta-propeller fold protein YncE